MSEKGEHTPPGGLSLPHQSYSKNDVFQSLDVINHTDEDTGTFLQTVPFIEHIHCVTVNCTVTKMMYLTNCCNTVAMIVGSKN